MRHLAPLTVALLLALSAADASAQWGARAPEGLPELERYEAPMFPPELAARSVFQGYAVVAFTVDDEGRVSDAFALGASHPAFADAVVKALAQWQLKPADSATTPRREVIRFAFRREETVGTANHLDAVRNQFPERTAMQSMVSPEELADPPQRIFGDKPGAVGSHPRGKAVVSFIIDPQGQVRVPVVQSATDPAFGAAALAAVRQWRYAPPQRKGIPVAVSLAQSFSYGPMVVASHATNESP